MERSDIINILASFLMVIVIGACQPPKKEAAEEEESIEIAKDANDSIFTDRKEEKDADFIVNAVAANYGEIKLAQLASNKSVDDEIKQMAEQFEKDHTKVLNELKGYADARGIAVPLEEAPGDSKDLGDLDKLSVDKFDKDWCQTMAKHHKIAIKRFESRMGKTEDPDLKALLSSTLPALKSHLSMIDKHADEY